MHAKLLINLCFALVGLYATFIISTVSVPVPVLCGVVSALMHYFFLAVFFWMAAEAILLHRKLVHVLKPDITNYVLIAMAICWGRLARRVQRSVSEFMTAFCIRCTLLYLYPSHFALAVVPAFIVAFSLAPFYQNYIHVAL